MDSQYKEDRERQMAEKGSEEPVFAPGAEVGKNLARLALIVTRIVAIITNDALHGV